MISASRRTAILALCAALAACRPHPVVRSDPLPSWRPGPARTAITGFVQRVTTPGASFVPAAERIAVFDNDGTLCIEQPIYVEFVFAVERARDMAAKNPKLAARPAFRKVMSKDPSTIATLSEAEIGELVAVTHSGMTPDAFSAEVRDWMRTAIHLRFGRTYQSLVYQPQLELLSYLRANGFKTFIVSGGGVDFMRAFAQQAYGVPPEQVIGSSGRTRFDDKDGKADLTKLAALDSIDDAAGKPQNIQLHIGRRPILAVGNSDGDLAMLQYAAAGARPNLEILIHHDDAQREYAYDRASKVGRLDAAWTEAVKRSWLVVSMKQDWRQVFPPQPH